MLEKWKVWGTTHWGEGNEEDTVGAQAIIPPLLSL